MRIRCGSTRFVLLVGDRAIKIGRMRPLRLLFRLLLLPFSKKRREHFFAKYGHTFLQAAWKDLCAGLYANRGEYEYCQAFKDPRVMPTIVLLLKGWIVIQPRGRPLLPNDVRSQLRVFEKCRGRECEMTFPEQFAVNADGQVVLVDYGRAETRTALKLG